MNKINGFLNIFWIAILYLFLSACTGKNVVQKWNEECEGKQICYIYATAHTAKFNDSIGYAYRHMIYIPMFDSLKENDIRDLINLAQTYIDTVGYDKPINTISYLNSFKGIYSFPAYPNYIDHPLLFKNNIANVGIHVTSIGHGLFDSKIVNFSILTDGEIGKELDSLDVDRLMKN